MLHHHTSRAKFLLLTIFVTTIEVEHVSCFPSSPKTTPFFVILSLLRLPHSFTTPKLSLHSPLASSLVQEKILAPFSSSPKRATLIRFMFSPTTTTHSFSTHKPSLHPPFSFFPCASFFLVFALKLSLSASSLSLRTGSLHLVWSFWFSVLSFVSR